ncbi:MAG TPA: SRPBCC family protein [Gemmataceae bacterium]|nr:SRPBCC family protein [Gemmataceae bacterium]
MPIIAVSIRIDAGPDGPFALAQHCNLRTEWDPTVRWMRFLEGARDPAAGVHVRVRVWAGLTIEVRFVSFRPPISAAMKMTRGPWMFRCFAGTCLVKPTQGGSTEVTLRYAFATRWRRLAWLLDPLIGRILSWDLRAKLRGLKWGVEQAGLPGRLIPRSGDKLP